MLSVLGNNARSAQPYVELIEDEWFVSMDHWCWQLKPKFAARKPLPVHILRHTYPSWTAEGSTVFFRRSKICYTYLICPIVTTRAATRCL